MLLNYGLARLLIFGIVLCSQVHAAVSVKGVAINCEANNAKLPFMDVYIFDSATVPRLVNLIKTLENRKDDPEGKLFPVWFAEVKHIVKSAKPLVHTETDRGGSFRAEIPSVANIVVFGYAEVESAPFYYAYRQVALLGHPRINVVLDFGNSSCTSSR